MKSFPSFTAISLGLSTQTSLKEECTTDHPRNQAGAFHHLTETLKPSITLHFSNAVIMELQFDHHDDNAAYFYKKHLFLKFIEVFCHPEHPMVTKTSQYENRAHQHSPCFHFKSLNRQYPFWPVRNFNRFQTRGCPGCLPRYPQGTDGAKSRCQAWMQRAGVPQWAQITRAAKEGP